MANNVSWEGGTSTGAQVADSFAARARVDSRTKGMAGNALIFTGGATTSGSAVVTMTSTTGLVAGMPFSGPNITSATTNAKVFSVDSATQIHISDVDGNAIFATATASGQTFQSWSPPLTPTIDTPTITANSATQYPSYQNFNGSATPKGGAVRVSGGYLLSEFGGSPANDYYTATEPEVGSGARNPANVPCVARFDLDGDTFEFVSGENNSAYRLWVNECAVTPGATLTTSSNNQISVHVASRGRRRIVLESIGSAQGTLSQIFTIGFPNQSAILPPSLLTDTLAWIGDSWGESGGALINADTLPNLVARLLGFAEVFNASVSGTGPTTPYPAGSSGSRGDYSYRIADVIAAAPAVVIYAGSINDATGYSGNAAQISTNVTADLKALVAGLPNAQIIMCGPWTASTPSASVLAVSNIYKTVCATLGIQYLDTTGQSSTPAVFSGTGTVLAPVGAGNTGTGNADFYNRGDGHADTPGLLAAAHWVAGLVGPLLRIQNG